MPRPKKRRKMTNPPHFKGFKPFETVADSSPVIIHYEEYEAIRLSDFELYGQVEASQIMDVSRPTYARIYESARRKVAEAFVQGRTIIFEGGKVYFDSEWYACNHCGCWFNSLGKSLNINKCALCGSSDVEQYAEDSDTNSLEDICICLVCGLKKEHDPGIPCKKELCPECNSPMIHKGTPHQRRMGNNHH